MGEMELQKLIKEDVEGQKPNDTRDEELMMQITGWSTWCGSYSGGLWTHGIL
jgi:hypothetical protein